MDRKPRLLLVDDQEVNLLLLKELVDSLELDSCKARNGFQALEKVESYSPDLILLDIMMPEMDGQEVLEKLKNTHRYKHIPVIMISAIDDMDRVAWCISQGAADYLVKPFKLTLLKARIHSCLETKLLLDRDRANQQMIQAANSKISEQNEKLRSNNDILQKEIERRVSVERDLRIAQRMALRNAHATGMAELASSVLHNVGNTLNSVNTSCHQLQEILNHSCEGKMKMANSLLETLFEAPDRDHEKQESLLHYYQSISNMWSQEHQRFTLEVESLLERVELIKATIQSQRNLSSGRVFTEVLNLSKVVDDVLRLQQESLSAMHIQVTRRLENEALVMGQKSKLSHVILNLLVNAREAIEHANPKRRCIGIELGENNLRNEVYLRISDTGDGIDPENLRKIFNHGYTTREDAEGFGLHATAIAVSEMEGRIEASSDGLGKGATFSLYFKKFQEPAKVNDHGGETTAPIG